MIFHNGHVFDFACASGALGFVGDGWWFEQPSRWLGSLRPQEFTIITKTLTYSPRKGQLKWWCPWRAVRFLENDSGVVNCVSLTNPGYRWWIDEVYQQVLQRGYKVIPSIMPLNKNEAKEMIGGFNKLDHIVGVEYNASCPNVEGHGIDSICELAEVMIGDCRHPLIVKLSYQDDYLAICKILDKKVSAFDLINSPPFRTVFPDGHSPLIKYGFLGAVSGPCIRKYAREVLKVVKEAKIQTPIISGGGIDSLEEVWLREDMGATGWTFGTVFMKRPWLPNQVIEQYRRMIRRSSVCNRPCGLDSQNVP